MSNATLSVMKDDERLTPQQRGIRDAMARGVRIGRPIREPHPEACRMITEFYDTGVALVEIARRLNAAGIPTISGKGIWRSDSVRIVARSLGLMD